MLSLWQLHKVVPWGSAPYPCEASGRAGGPLSRQVTAAPTAPVVRNPPFPR